MAFGLNIPIAFKLDAKGLHKAKHDVESFKETLKKGLELGGIGLGVSEIVNIGRESVKAAQAEIISQRQLDTVLERTTKQHGKNSKSVEKYITAASRATGVVRSRLRPAFSVLARTTGDTKKASDLLNKSMDIAAGTGKPLETVIRAVAKAYAGNDKTLRRLLPGIKDNQKAMDVATTTFKNARLTLADPFQRLSNVVDMAKESLGKALLPIVTSVVKEITKPGGLADTVGKFFEDMSNPKTDVGKTFHDFKKSLKDTMGTVGAFFGMFDPKKHNGMVGFMNVLTMLAKAVPYLLVFKGAMMAMAAVKNVAMLIQFMKLWLLKPTGTGNGPGTPIATPGGKGAPKTPTEPKLPPMEEPKGPANNLQKIGRVAGYALVGAAVAGVVAGFVEEGRLSFDKQERIRTNKLLHANNPAFANARAQYLQMQQSNGLGSKPFTNKTTNNVNIHVTSNDPNAVVDAIKKYTRVNGPLPKNVTGVK